MTLRLRVRWTLVSVLALAAIPCGIYACGGDDSTPDSPDLDVDSSVPANDGGVRPDGGGTPDTFVPPSTATVASTCAALYGEQVKALASCCNATDIDAEPGRTYNALAKLSQIYCEPQLQTSITAGRVRLDDAKVQACLDANKARYTPPSGCSYLLDTTSAKLAVGEQDPIAACEETVVGLVDVGASCAGPVECKPGLTCLGYSSSLLSDGGVRTVDGKCQQPPAVGSNCGSASLDGGPGQSSERSTSLHPACTNGWCAFGQCQKLGASGDPCFGINQCATGLQCHNSVCGTAPARSDVNGDCKQGRFDCKLGLRCNRPGAPAGTCVAKVGSGTTCTGGGLTDDDNVCKGRCGADSGATGQCVSYCGSN
ncbi:MAG: hypothetical protein JWM74_4567 [Myxococcaceae bacterium]|nr:hypothetical protein [Myxococcaceae bacterium]